MLEFSGVIQNIHAVIRNISNLKAKMLPATGRTFKKVLACTLKEKVCSGWNIFVV